MNPPSTTNLDDAILKHLAGSSDEHRVVGLLMLTKHVSLQSNNINSLRKSVYDTLDKSFLRRLLVTNTKVGDSATDELALSMLSFFCHDSSMASSYLDTMPTVCQKWKKDVTLLEEYKLSTATAATTTTTTTTSNTTSKQKIIDAMTCVLAFLSSKSATSILQQQAVQFNIIQ